MYNITLEDYDTLFQLQGGVCAICGKPETSAKVSNLAVDHNHINGSMNLRTRVRILLEPLN